MTSYLKAIGLALVAVFIFAAMAASAASAAEYHAEEASEAKPVFLFGQSSDTVFTITHSPSNVTVACATTKLTGSSSTKTSAVTKLHPTYSGCKLGEVAATVTVPASCGYELSVAKDEGIIEYPEGSGKFHTFWKGKASVASCATPIKIVAATCTLEVNNQSGLEKVSMFDEGSGTSRDIFMIMQLGALKAKQSEGCPGGAGEFSTADYTATMTLKGFTNEALTTQQGIWVE